MAKKKDETLQNSLFGSELQCPDVGGLPLITDSAGGYEVIAPASAYQPLLLRPLQKNVDVSPGALDEYESKFVRDLVKFLYPAGNAPRSPKTPMQWGDKEVWIKRNLEKNNDSFRLRIDESDWYYPDFVVWIIDHQNKVQTLGFVDPKGLTMGIKGWGDYKALSTLYMPHVVEQCLEKPTIIDGEEWEFRIRGVLLSNTKFKDLVSQEKLFAYDDKGELASLSEAEFVTARIVFQQDFGIEYIGFILSLLDEDNELDRLLQKAATVYHEQPFTPETEADYDLLLRNKEHEGSESEFVANIVRRYLLPNAEGQVGVTASEQRRSQLTHYAKEGRFGIGHEKAKAIAEQSFPCRELWLRMLKENPGDNYL
jgi:hypothetical protein